MEPSGVPSVQLSYNPGGQQHNQHLPAQHGPALLPPAHQQAAVSAHAPSVHSAAANQHFLPAQNSRTQAPQQAPQIQVAPALQQAQQVQQQASRTPQVPHPQSMSYQSKYGELLNVIEDLGREIKPTYAGSKMAQERLKKGIMHARTLVRECLAEVDKSARQ